MKKRKLARITMILSMVLNIANLFTEIDLHDGANWMIICALLLYWLDEQQAHFEAVNNERKEIIKRIMAETVVCEIETEIVESEELLNKRELLEMIEEKKKIYEDFRA